MGEIKEDLKDKLKFKLELKLILILVLIVIVLGAVIGMLVWGKSKKKEAEIITTAKLEKILNVSDLSTFGAIYNGVARVANAENPAEIDYYVAYEARVKAGIDFNQLKVNVDAENKVVTVIVPEIKINDVIVDIASLDYIFINKKANTETVSEQAYRECIKDATEETEAEHMIYDLAKENADHIVEALVKPFVNQVDPEYELVIK